MVVSLVACMLFGGDTSAEGQASTASPAGAGPITTRHLENGLTLVVQEDHRLPLVALAIGYDVGERAAPAGLGGVVTLTTRLMQRATRHVPPAEYARLLARAGASSAGERTTPDYTMLDVVLPSNQWALPLWLWSDQMGFFTADESQFAVERAKLAEQRRTALEGGPLWHLDAFAIEEIFPQGHPYRNAVAGSPEDVQRL
ncbi:MAG TPA: hypothetical protein VKU41_28300, partial [Polyangiaceae bacterium]|nr:hypothetical protein [Polyangiaceae bacterium]